MAFFVGIDQALRKIGVAVITAEGSVATLSLIRPPRNLKDVERLSYLENSLVELLQKYTPIKQVAMEGQAYNASGMLDQLGQIIGVIKVSLHSKFQTVPITIAPTSLKKFVTGFGNATKNEMRTATQKYWSIDIDQDDKCDAHGLAQMAREYTLGVSKVRHQLEAMKSVRRKKVRKRIRKVFPKTL